MRNLIVAVSVFSAASCTFNSLSSNLPDGGRCERPTAPAGSGKVDGPVAFTALASYQSASQLLGVDGGVSATTVSINLYDKAVACADLADGGAAPAIGFLLWNDDSSVATGVYSAGPDAGSRRAIGAMPFERGAATSKSGTVTLNAVEACAVAGTFEVQMATTDGGAFATSGTFSSVFCDK